MSTNAGNPDANGPILNIGEALGADDRAAIQCFTIYIPNKDGDDQEFGTQRLWVLEAIRLLTEINGGATAIPVEGGWMTKERRLIQEHPVVVYSYVAVEPFLANLPRIREFLHRLGRETKQGEIAFEYDNHFYRIHALDQPTPS